MAFAPFQIVRYKFPLGNATYPRPCVIVQISPDGTLAILPVSTKAYGNEAKFTISKEDPEFKATGLDETSYVYGHPVLDIAPSMVIKTKGALTGDLKRRFIAWIG